MIYIYNYMYVYIHIIIIILIISSIIIICISLYAHIQILYTLRRPSRTLTKLAGKPTMNLLVHISNKPCLFTGVVHRDKTNMKDIETCIFLHHGVYHINFVVDFLLEHHGFRREFMVGIQRPTPNASVGGQPSDGC